MTYITEVIVKYIQENSVVLDRYDILSLIINVQQDVSDDN